MKEISICALLFVWKGLPLEMNRSNRESRSGSETFAHEPLVEIYEDFEYIDAV
jgi:hypothetical protein